MSSIKVQFTNQAGFLLKGRLEMPVDQHPHNYAVFAHCFTCTKNLTAVRNISRSLTLGGIAVLRFDFTGLGESEGEFADTTFSSNVEDLIAAADFLAEHYRPPSILIGHSLGGAAVLFAAARLPSIKAVATIGAPAAPQHVQHLLQGAFDAVGSSGQVPVAIAGRTFMLKKRFVEDLLSKDLPAMLQRLRKALLFLHSPQDETVAIDNARMLYEAAHHPKSFVSLDGADHLLSRQEDSRYVGELIAAWARRYIELPKELPLVTAQQVAVRIGRDRLTSEIKVGRHAFVADEPLELGGNDFGPNPYDLLSAALGACTAMTLRLYADRKQWDLRGAVVHLNHRKIHAEDCAGCETAQGRIDRFERVIDLEGDLTPEQKDKLLEIADKCPVHKTLHGEIEVVTRLKN